MKYLILLLSLIIVVDMSVRSQTVAVNRVKGQLIDEQDEQPIEGATVVLLHAKDFSMAVSTLTDSVGAFVLYGFREGNYKICITYLGHQSIQRDVAIITSGVLTNLGLIRMRKTGINLKLVEVVGDMSPVVVKKDTTEFNVGFFNSIEGDIVEELLRKLPGIQIQRDGTIKVNGKIVEKLLVNGMPFFGSDSKEGARNLPVDIIDRIQVIDKRSDWSEFVGIGDGQSEKVINLVIKQDRRGDIFGKADGALGTRDRFAISGSINQFNDKEQWSVLANATNINGYKHSGEQYRGASESSRVANNWNCGGNYVRNFDRGLRVNLSYRTNAIFTGDQSIRQRKDHLLDSTFYYNQDASTYADIIDNFIDAGFEYKRDTMNVLSISTAIGYSSNNSLQESKFFSFTGMERLTNSGNMSVNSYTINPRLTTMVMVGKKFRKMGRNINLNFRVGYNSNNQIGVNIFHSLFVKSDGRQLLDTLKQKKSAKGFQQSITSSVAYTEPFAKNYYLTFEYAYTSGSNKSDKISYDFDAIRNEYNVVNDSLTNYFISKHFSHQAGLRLTSVRPKYIYNLGFNIQFNNLIGQVSTHNLLSRKTTNYFPTAAINYNISPGKQLGIFYNGSVEQPDIHQLQPIVDNSSPLYITLGNPELKPSFNNNFNFRYSSFNSRSLHGLFITANLSFVNNMIVSSTWLDSMGRQITMPVNADGFYTSTVSITNDIYMKKIRSSVNASTLLGLSRQFSYQNGEKIGIRRLNITENLSLNYTDKLLNLIASTRIDYNVLQYSVIGNIDERYLDCGLSLSGKLYLPLGFIIGGSVDYMLNTGRANEYNSDAVILNALVSKNLLKHRRLLASVQGFDLLKRNKGVRRNVGMNYTEDVQTSILQRYFLVNFTYFLKKNIAGTK